MKWIELTILCLQVLIAFGQWLLSCKMNRQDSKRGKGYFLIEKTNIPHLKEGESHYLNYFNLTSPLRFYVTGNDDVLVVSENIHIDRHTIQSDLQLGPVFFSRDNRFGKCDVSIPLTEDERNKKTIDVLIRFTLRNTAGYQYVEQVDMSFEKQENPHNWWYLSKFNLLFDAK